MTTNVSARFVKCSECGHPWGILDPEPGYVPPSEWPPLRPTYVVFVSEAAAGWLADRFGCSHILPGCFQAVDDIDVPQWWIKSRRNFPALSTGHNCYSAKDEDWPGWPS